MLHNFVITTTLWNSNLLPYWIECRIIGRSVRFLLVPAVINHFIIFSLQNSGFIQQSYFPFVLQIHAPILYIAPNQNGERPLHIAKSRGYSTIVDLLQSAMQNPPQKVSVWYTFCTMTFWLTLYYLPQPSKPFQESTLKEGTTGVGTAQPQQAPPQTLPYKVVLLAWIV